MKTIYPVLADTATSISELKKNPMAVIAEANGLPIAVLNRNKPAFYCIAADTYEYLLEKLDDMELAHLVRARQSSAEVELDIDDL